MNVLLYQQHAAGIFFATLGRKPAFKDVEYFAKKLMDGMSTAELASWIIKGPEGQKHYATMNNEQKITFIYQNVNSSPPTQEQLQPLLTQLNGGKALGNIAQDVFNTLDSYKGTDSTTLEHQHAQQETINQSLYPAFNGTPQQHSGAEDVSALFYAMGSIASSSGINYWGSVINTGKNTFAEVAQKFVNVKADKFGGLNDSDFIKTIYAQTHKRPPAEGDINHYLDIINNNSGTRGDVVAAIINDLRSSTAPADSMAQQQLAKIEHVYTPGELPSAEYQEQVASIYMTLAGRGIDASGLETWSKMLASGTSNYDLLKLLSKNAEFSHASNYEKVYYQLHGTQHKLTTVESQAILLRAGNDKLKATLLVIDYFRNGESLIGSNYPVSSQKVFEYENALGTSLGYKTAPMLDTSANGGNPSGTVNSGHYHQLTNAELSMFSTLTLNVIHDTTVDLSLAANVKVITLTGSHAGNSITLSSLANHGKDIVLSIDQTNLSSFSGNILLGKENDTIVFAKGLDLSTLNAKITLGGGTDRLDWQGNSVNGSSNKVSNDLYAVFSEGILNANFITKTVNLTTAGDGSLSGVISTNLKNFSNYAYIDLTNYRGTGDIYLDGTLAGTDGTNVFDSGLLVGRATLHNPNFSQVKNLTQADVFAAPDLLLSGKADNLHIINTLTDGTLIIDKDLTADSNLMLESEHRSYEVLQVNAYTIDIMRDLNVGTGAAPNYGFTYNVGTIGYITNYGNKEQQVKFTISVHSVNTIVTLSGGHNNVTNIDVSSIGAFWHNFTIDLHVKADFSDSLETVGHSLENALNFPQMSLKLTMDIGGSGGGDFYANLKSLQNGGRFDSLTTQLAGKQLTANGGNGDDTFNVVGNTTVNGVEGSDKVIFAHSTVDSMVKIATQYISSTKIEAGDANHHWTFSKQAEKQMAVYGDYGSSAALNTLFDAVDTAAGSSAQSLFSALLSKATGGTSENALSEVGALKLGNSLYVVIDKNNNHTFDDQDIVFSLGNHDLYQTVVETHYSSPQVVLNAVSAAPAEEAFA
ncbi:ABC-type protease/lipase transport system, ATPase and permease components [Serratia plymuthica]|nr:ABC-type protease/lipase transport system, ATPase and permease components [Serratia plymuthica]